MSNKNEMSWLFTISQKTEMLTGTSVLVVLFLNMHAATRTCSNRNSLFMLKVGRSITIHILPNILRSKDKETMKLSQLIEYDMRKIFLEKWYTKCGGEVSARPFFNKSKLNISLVQLSEQYILSKNFLKVIKMVNRNFDGNHKIFRGRARQFSIDCRLCWYGVQKYSDYGVLNHALEVLERFWHGFGILVFLREKIQFSIDDCELEVVVENI